MLIIVPIVILSLIAVAVWLMVKTRSYIAALFVTAICCMVPVGCVMRDCMIRSTSEACVWGKSFLPLYLFLALGAASVLSICWSLIVLPRRRGGGG